MTEQQVLRNAINTILEVVPNRQPFCCLGLSAMLYAELEKVHLKPKLVAGSLSYKNELLFKMDYSLISEISSNKSSNVISREFGGHAWIELENRIIDISIFTTVYSDKFNKKCKNEIVQKFGVNTEYLIIDKSDNQTGFEYQRIEDLNDIIITGVLKGMYLLRLSS